MGEPLVLTRVVAQREWVVAADDEARRSGVRPGMTRAEARALCPGLRHAPHDPARAARALEALARWATKFTPAVAAVQGAGPPALYLDLTGCERAFGGVERLVGFILASFDRLKLDARAAVAPTIGAAWALTFGRRTHGRVYGAEDLAAALPPLPVEALRLDEEAVAALRHLGVETIGLLAGLPRAALPSRFGPLLVRRLDQAFGRAAAAEPLAPLAFPRAIEAAVDFDGVVTAVEAVWAALRQLVGRVVAQMTERGCGAKQVDVVFLRPGAPEVRKSITLSAASREGAVIFNLLRCAMETLAPAATPRRTPASDGPAHDVRYQPEGFVGVRLRVPAVERLTEEQTSLLEQEARGADRELARLIERLRVKLGERAVTQAERVESHLPELAFRCSPSPQFTPPSPSSRPAPAPRPLHLLPKPVEVRVTVAPSHDRDGRPVSFTHEGRVHRVAHAVGPERLSGPWWLGRNKTRDYFDAMDEAGQRTWLFRVVETGKWYLHGTFG